MGAKSHILYKLSLDKVESLPLVILKRVARSWPHHPNSLKETQIKQLKWQAPFILIGQWGNKQLKLNLYFKVWLFNIKINFWDKWNRNLFVLKQLCYSRRFDGVFMFFVNERPGEAASTWVQIL